MNYQLKNGLSRAIRGIVLPITLGAAVSIASAAEVELLEIPLAKKGLEDGKTLTVSSSSGSTIKTSQFYNYSVTGTMRGAGGMLGEWLPKELPINKVFSRGSSFLTGNFKNKGDTNTAVLLNRELSSKQKLADGTKVSRKAMVKIELINGVAKLSATNVSIRFKAPGKPWKRVTGKLVFGKKSKLTLSTAPVIGFKVSPVSVSESAGQVQLVVERTGPSVIPVSVTYKAIPQSANSLNGFVEQNGVINFDAGVTEQTITVNFSNNDLVDGNRYFLVRLLTVSSGAEINPVTAKSQCRVNIIDDDFNPNIP